MDQKNLHKSVEETGVIYVDWMFLLLWLTEGRGKFQGKVGSELRPERDRRGSVKGNANIALPQHFISWQMYKVLSAVHTGVNQLGEEVRLEALERGPPGIPES